jgi:hypothetical protein
MVNGCCLSGRSMIFCSPPNLLLSPTKRLTGLMHTLHLRMPMKRQGLVSMYNDLDIQQSQWYIKISIQTWLQIMMEPYFADWLDIPLTLMPTPLGPSEAFIKRLYSTEGSSDLKVQAQLEKQMGLKYCCAISQLIWPMTMRRLDLVQAVVKLAQHSAAPAEVHYLGVKTVFRYLAATITEGIYFWRTEPIWDLPDHPMPKIWSTPHDIKLANRPQDEPTKLSGSMDSGWGSCLLTRRSFGGVMMRMAGGLVAYKGELQPTVAGSSTEAEFTMTYDGGRMSLYLRSILWDLGVPQDAATILYEDNDVPWLWQMLASLHPAHVTSTSSSILSKNGLKLNVILWYFVALTLRSTLQTTSPSPSPAFSSIAIETSTWDMYLLHTHHATMTLYGFILSMIQQIL